MPGNFWMLRCSVRLLILHFGFIFWIVYVIFGVCWCLQMLVSVFVVLSFCFCMFSVVFNWAVDVAFVHCDVLSPTPGPQLRIRDSHNVVHTLACRPGKERAKNMHYICCCSWVVMLFYVYESLSHGLAYLHHLLVQLWFSCICSALSQ